MGDKMSIWMDNQGERGWIIKDEQIDGWMDSVGDRGWADSQGTSYIPSPWNGSQSRCLQEVFER